MRRERGGMGEGGRRGERGRVIMDG